MIKKYYISSDSYHSDKRVLLIYTGGTLGMFQSEAEGPLKPLNFDKILNHIPELERLSCKIEIIAFEKPIDSSDMNPSNWSLIGDIIKDNYVDFQGFVIIHGTDTMAYTASALSFMLEGLAKPVILTGSQLPVGLARSDAKSNLLTSIELIKMEREGVPLIREVCVFFDYKLFRGNRAKKIENENFDAFHSENYPVLAEAGIDIDLNEHYLWKTPLSQNLNYKNQFNTNVFIWKIFPGMRFVGIAKTLIDAGFEGIVLETYGAGNTPTSEEFLKEIEFLCQRGIYILNVSQCLGGSVRPGLYDSSSKMEKLGVIGGQDISSEAAVVKMMFILGNYKEQSKIKELLTLSTRGEMSK